MTLGQLFTRPEEIFPVLSEKQMGVETRNRNTTWITGKRADRVFKHLKISCYLVSAVNSQYFFVFVCSLACSPFLHCWLLSFCLTPSVSFFLISLHTHLSQVQWLKLALLPVCVCLPNCLAQEVLVAASRHSETWFTWSSCLINPSTSLSSSFPHTSSLQAPSFFFQPSFVTKMLFPLTSTANLKAHINCGHVSRTFCVFE